MTDWEEKKESNDEERSGMEMLLAVLGHPFTWGLGLGLVFAAWALSGGWSARRALKKEVRRLEEHCRTAAELGARGNQALMDENAELKRANENLRISLAALKDKPDRAELLKLCQLDKAVHLMYARAPGFAPAWEGAMQEAQAEIDRSASGLVPFIRRLVPFAGGRTKPPAALPEAGEAKDGA